MNCINKQQVNIKVSLRAGNKKAPQKGGLFTNNLSQLLWVEIDCARQADRGVGGQNTL